MKRLAIALALASLTTSAALAQTVVIAPEQRTVIREYVREKPVASIDLPGIELNIGSTLPQEVELYPIERDGVTYRYTRVGERVILVDPETRAVIDVLD